MSFQSMANHISMESVFRSLSIGHWPKEQVVAGDFLLTFKHFQAQKVPGNNN